MKSIYARGLVATAGLVAGCIIVALPQPAAAQGRLRTYCMSDATIQQDATFKGNTAVRVRNDCSVPVDVRICLSTSRGWNCGVAWGVDPGETRSHSSFNYDGEWFVSAKDAGSDTRLESPE